MKQNWKRLAYLTLALNLPGLALAQSDLILPRSLDDIDALTKGLKSTPCVKCGIVTNIHTEQRPVKTKPRPTQPPAAGVGSNVATTPFLGSGNVVADSRQAMKPSTYYKITVRYEDGTYAFFEQDDEPAFQKGDKVETTEGRLELREDI